MESKNYLETFVKTPGLYHLAEIIVAHLDTKTLARCRLVSKSLKDCVETPFFGKSLDQTLNQKTAFGKSSILQAYPKWIKVFEGMKQQKPTDISQFLDTIKKYLKSFKKCSSLYMDPLQFAVKQLYTAGDFFEAVLQTGYQLDKLEGKKLFRAALESRNGKILEILIDQSDDLGIDLTAKDASRDYNVLHVVCVIKRVSLLRKIIAKADKIDVNAEGEGPNETTAFFKACEGNFTEGVKILLENAQELRIDLNAMGRTSTGPGAFSRSNIWTPFGIAVKNGNVGVVRKLLKASKKNGIVVNKVNWNSDCGPFSIACVEGNVEVAKLLLKHDKDQAKKEMNFVDLNGKSIFHYACESNSLPMVQLLLANFSCIDFNARDNNGQTPLHLVCQSGSSDICQFYIEHLPSLDFNARNNNGNTPFHLACQNGHLDIVKIMIDKMTFIRLNTKNDNGATPFHFACQSRCLELVEYFVKDLSDQVDFSAKNDLGSTPFHYAIGERNMINKTLELVKFLISQRENIKIDLTSRTINGTTPLSLFKKRLDSAPYLGYQKDIAEKIIDDLSALEEEENHTLVEEAKRRKLTISLPKSIDKQL